LITHTSSRIFEVSRKRLGRGSNASAFSFSSFRSACSFSACQLLALKIAISLDIGLPTANQSGQTIRHLRFRFSDNASHIGTLQAEGG